MGNLLRILYCRDTDDPSKVDIFVDFESRILLVLKFRIIFITKYNIYYITCKVLHFIWLCFFLDAIATTSERPVWSEVQKVLKEANEILRELATYKGAASEIREV